MTDQPYRIAFLIYPRMTQFDFTGPAEILHRMPGAEISVIWKTTEPVVSDSGVIFVPTATIAEETRFNMI